MRKCGTTVTAKEDKLQRSYSSAGDATTAKYELDDYDEIYVYNKAEEANSQPAVFLTSFLASTCGYFVRPYLIPPWFIWAYHISPYKFALDALYRNEFTGQVEQRSGRDVLEFVFQVDGRFSLLGNVAVLALYVVAFQVLAWGWAEWRARPVKKSSRPSKQAKRA